METFDIEAQVVIVKPTAKGFVADGMVVAPWTSSGSLGQIHSIKNDGVFVHLPPVAEKTRTTGMLWVQSTVYLPALVVIGQTWFVYYKNNATSSSGQDLNITSLCFSKAPAYQINKSSAMQVVRKLDKAGNATKTFTNWISYFDEQFLNVRTYYFKPHCTL